MRYIQSFIFFILFIAQGASGTDYYNSADCGDLTINGKYQENLPTNKEFSSAITIANINSEISVALRDRNNYVIHCELENYPNFFVLQEVEPHDNSSQYYLYDRVSLQMIPRNDRVGKYEWSYTELSALYPGLPEGVGYCIFGKNKRKFVKNGRNYCVQAG